MCRQGGLHFSFQAGYCGTWRVLMSLVAGGPRKEWRGAGLEGWPRPGLRGVHCEAPQQWGSREERVPQVWAVGEPGEGIHSQGRGLGRCRRGSRGESWRLEGWGGGVGEYGGRGGAAPAALGWGPLGRSLNRGQRG